MPELSDHQLADHLQYHRSLAVSANAEAIGLDPMPRKLVAAVWAHFAKRSDRIDASDRAAQIKIAIETAEAMRAFASMTYSARLKLEGVETAAWYDATAAAEAAAILAEHPVLGPIKSEIDQEAAEWAAEVQRIEAVKRAASAASYPAALLVRLRRSGVHLALEAKGRVAMPANQTISATDRQEIIEHYDGLAAALRAEAEASRLVPVK